MGRGVHEMGDALELELRDGDFARVTIVPSGLPEMKTVITHHAVFTALGIPVVSDIPE